MKEVKYLFIAIACLLDAVYLWGQGQFSAKQKLPQVPHAAPYADVVIDGSRNVPPSSLVPWQYPMAWKQPISHDAALVIPGHSVRHLNGRNGTPAFWTAEPSATLVETKSEAPSVEEMVNTALDFMLENSGIFRLDNPHAETQIISTETDDLGKTHIRFQQQYKGVPVWGSDFYVHFDGNKMYCFNGRYEPTPRGLNVVPTVSASVARQMAMFHLKGEGKAMHPLTTWAIALGMQPVHSRLVIYPSNEKTLHLAWHLTLRPNAIDRYEYFVDAHSGQIIHHYYNTHANGPVTGQGVDLNGQTRTLELYQVGSTYLMLDASRPMFNAGASQIPQDPKGAIITLTANNTPLKNVNYVTSSSLNNWPSDAVSAHYNGGTTYEYFRTTHGRNSIDGQGGTIIGVTNVSDKDGSSMPNAYWNGVVIAYGNGGTPLKPLAGALDVAGHEMAHGVTEKTAALVYEYQSGALNEHMSDVFGACVDRDDWKVGENIVKINYFPSGAMRDLSNPHNGGSPGDFYWQPAHMNEYVQTDKDNGGVHINSGIPNYAFYKFASVHGHDKGEKIWYRALTKYLTRRSQFIDARNAIVQSAKDLYGDNSTEAQAVAQAFTDVGIGGTGGGGGGGTGRVVYPTVQGNDYLLVHASGNANNTLYLVEAWQGGQVYPISSTLSRRKASILDGGDLAVFINSSNHQVHIIDMNPNNPDEQAVPGLGNQWSTVAVSPDGNRIALVSIYEDSSIYVVNLDANPPKMARFMLYQPSYSSQPTYTVRYADVIQWDLSGEYLLFDKFSSIPGNPPVNQWDIGFIHVWDNNKNDFGTGTIYNLFTNLPSNLHVANPSFAENTPDVLAFDLYDSDNGEYKVMVADLAGKKTGEIFTQSLLGIPSFTRTDNAIIFTALSSGGDTVIAVRSVSDYTQPQGNAQLLINNAIWADWFGKGQRAWPSGIRPLESAVPLLKIRPNPVDEQLRIELPVDERVRSARLEIRDAMGRHVQSVQLKETPSSSWVVDVRGLPSGIYWIQWIENGGRIARTRFVKR